VPSSKPQDEKRRAKTAAARTLEKRASRLEAKLSGQRPVLEELAQEMVRDQRAVDALVEAAAKEDDVTLLSQIANVRNRRTSCPTFNTSSKLATYFRATTEGRGIASALRSIASNPSTFDPAAFPQALRPSLAPSSIVRSTTSDPISNIHQYLRRLHATCANLIKESEEFGKIFPAEEAFEAAYQTYLKERFSLKQVISRWYTGTSRSLTGAERNAEDGEAEDHHRFSNYVSANGLDATTAFETFEFILSDKLWEVGGLGRTHDFMAHTVARDFESLAIAGFTLGRLNSSQGGLTPSWAPSASLLDMRARVETFLAPANLKSNVASLPTPSSMILPRPPRLPTSSPFFCKDSSPDCESTR